MFKRFTQTLKFFHGLPIFFVRANKGSTREGRHNMTTEYFLKAAAIWTLNIVVFYYILFNM